MRVSRSLITRGAALACVAAALPQAASATPPGRNGLIACHMLADAPDPPLYTVHPTTGEERLIALDRSLFSGPAGPSWSPDGARLAFAGPANPDPAANTPSDIFINDLRTPASRNLTRSSAHELNPAWSPTGTWIAYERHEASGPSIWRVRTDGTGARRIVAGGLEPAWSPDGRRLAFSLSGEIYTSDANGAYRRRVTYDRDVDRQPTWSPDGTRLAWTSDLFRFEGSAEVWIATRTGAQPTRLTFNTSDDEEPVWSPDGRFIAVARGGGPGHLLYVIDLSNRKERQLGHACSGPDWQRLR